MKRANRFAACAIAALLCSFFCFPCAAAYSDYIGGIPEARDEVGGYYAGSGVLGLSQYLLSESVITPLAAERLDENGDGILNALDASLRKRRLLKNPDEVMRSHFNSTFIEGWLANDFSEEQWQETISQWQAVGITSVIIGETVIREASGEINAFYSSSLVLSPENTALGGKIHYDSVDKILSHCQAAGIKCFVSMGTDSSFWNINICRHDSSDGPGQEAFIEQTKRLLPYMNELYDLYASRYPDAFYGWYFSPEISNSVEYEDVEKCRTGVETLSLVLDLYLAERDRLDASMPMLLSPYVNIKAEATWCTHDSAVLGGFWQSVLETAAFRSGDILSPQDSVGAGGMQLEHLAEWTKAYRTAVDNAGKGMKLWSNAESFRILTDMPDRSWAELTQSSFVTTLVAQLELAEPYVDGFTSCSFSSYYNTVSAGESYFEAYQQYLRYGVPDSEPPSPPTEFSVSTVQLSGRNEAAMQLVFSGAHDNIGIARAEIYVDGKLLTYRVATRWQTWENGKYIGITEPSGFFDLSFDLGNCERSYEIVLYDCVGNRSEPVTVRVTASNGELRAEAV